jgi:23S rRNA (guanosine2251-2'-O)-methyltransferase
MSKKKHPNHEVLYGIHPVLEALKAKSRTIYTIYTTKPAPHAFSSIEKLLAKHTKVQFVKRDVLYRLSGSTEHQNVVAFASPFMTKKSFFSPQKAKALVLLDSIQDPRNLGGIIRSAHCAGFDGVVLTRKKSAPISATVVKASAGLIHHMPVYEAASPVHAAQLLQEADYAMYVTTLQGEDISQVAFQEPLCLVIGNEATGVSSDIIKKGTQVTIPQKSSDISYNASVAAGITLFITASRTNRI